MKKISWHSLTFKQKNKFLLVAVMVLAYLMYAFAISNTLDAREACALQQSQIDSVKHAPAKLKALKSELALFASLTGDQSDTADDMHEHLLNFVSVYCNAHGIQLREFVQPVRFSQKEWLVETHPFTVDGSFTQIVQLIDALERFDSGRVVSVNIFSKRPTTSFGSGAI